MKIILSTTNGEDFLLDEVEEVNPLTITKKIANHMGTIKTRDVNNKICYIFAKHIVAFHIKEE